MCEISESLAALSPGDRLIIAAIVVAFLGLVFFRD